MPTPQGPQRRLARQFREAALRPTPREAEELQRLERLVRAEAITVFAASAILTDVIRGQHERGRQAA